MPLPTLCHDLFDRLGPLHKLRAPDLEALLTAAHVRSLMHEVCSDDSAAGRAACADWYDSLGYESQPIVNATLQLAVEMLPHSGYAAWMRLSLSEKRTVVWLAAILRFAESVDFLGEGGDSPGVVYAAWTDEAVCVELSAPGFTSDELRRLAHVSALESVTGRRVLLSAPRRRSEQAA